MRTTASVFRYATTLHTIGTNRTFFTTEGGRIGLGPAGIRKSNDACIFFGSEQLFILREDARKSRYTMIGDAYVDGLMNGEGFELKKPEDTCVFAIG
jgi:hypothetical protein